MPQFSDSVRYYDQNAQQYFDSTVGIDVESLYDLFLPHVPAGSKILDAGLVGTQNIS